MDRISLGVRLLCFFFSSRRRHTRFDCDWSSDVCSSDLGDNAQRKIDPEDTRPESCRVVVMFIAGSQRFGLQVDQEQRKSHRQLRKDVMKRDRKSTRLNSSHSQISYAVFCLKKKKTQQFSNAHDNSTRRRPPLTPSLGSKPSLLPSSAGPRGVYLNLSSPRPHPPPPPSSRTV